MIAQKGKRGYDRHRNGRSDMGISGKAIRWLEKGKGKRSEPLHAGHFDNRSTK